MVSGFSMASAQVAPLGGEAESSYYYIDHYEVVIEDELSAVWPVLVDLGKWMPGLAEANDPMPPVTQGAVLHLYDDFYLEVAKVIPEKMILLVNLPNSQEGEDTQGIAMISAHGFGEETLVSLFMSRIYFWLAVDENPLRATRESADFIESRRAAYEDNVLSRLRLAVETAQ
jgi:hypothetical protein